MKHLEAGKNKNQIWIPEVTQKQQEMVISAHTWYLGRSPLHSLTWSSHKDHEQHIPCLPSGCFASFIGSNKMMTFRRKHWPMATKEELSEPWGDMLQSHDLENRQKYSLCGQVLPRTKCYVSSSCVSSPAPQTHQGICCQPVFGQAQGTIDFGNCSCCIAATTEWTFLEIKYIKTKRETTLI